MRKTRKDSDLLVNYPVLYSFVCDRIDHHHAIIIMSSSSSSSPDRNRAGGRLIRRRPIVTTLSSTRTNAPIDENTAAAAVAATTKSVLLDTKNNKNDSCNNNNNKPHAISSSTTTTTTSNTTIATAMVNWIVVFFLAVGFLSILLRIKPLAADDNNNREEKESPSAAAAAVFSTHHHHHSLSSSSKSCRIYLAPSSLPHLMDTNGLGLYTTQSILQGQRFFLGSKQGTDGPNIPVWLFVNNNNDDANESDVNDDDDDDSPTTNNNTTTTTTTKTPASTWQNKKHRHHHHPAAAADDDDDDDDWITLFDNYWWGRGVADQVSYEAIPPPPPARQTNNAVTIMDFQITFGALPNHHCVLESIDVQWPDVPYIDDIVNRNRDPGAGAFSYHTGRVFFAMRDLEAGDELFLNYGYCDRDDDDEDLPDWAKHNMPMTDDFTTAAKMTILIWNKLQKDKDNIGHKTTDTLLQTAYRDAVIQFGPKATKQVIALVPTTMEQINAVMKLNSHADIHHDEKSDDDNNNNDRSLMGIARSLAKYMETNRRSIDWIHEHGVCVENMIPGPSHIRQAGQGAFAQWSLRKGEIIVPVPLLHILDRDVLSIDNDKGKLAKEQLLLNYCFGHPESSLLLCPDTNVILINHCSSRRPNNENDECNRPNAKLQWASDWDLGINKKWLEMSLDEIARQPGRGLALEVVATRDITPGEEIFLDYGKGWEDAWNRHVQEWRPASNITYLSIKELNKDPTGPLPMLVSGDLRRAERHKEVFTGCIYWPTKEDEADEYYEENAEWTNMANEDILYTYADRGKRFRGNYSTHEDGAYWPCAVLLPEIESKDRYIVRIYQSPFFDSMPWNENGVPRLLTNYPRSSIHYFREPYQQDQMLPNAFRHFIEIPDAIFPPRWKNRI